MSNRYFDKVKDVVTSIPGYDALKDKVADAAEGVSDRAKYAGQMTKLAVNTNMQQERIHESYEEIGKLYYEHYREYPDAFMTELCDEITAATAAIAENQRQMDALRAGRDGQHIEAAFEEIPDGE